MRSPSSDTAGCRSSCLGLAVSHTCSVFLSLTPPTCVPSPLQKPRLSRLVYIELGIACEAFVFAPSSPQGLVISGRSGTLSGNPPSRLYIRAFLAGTPRSCRLVATSTSACALYAAQPWLTCSELFQATKQKADGRSSRIS